MNGSIGLRKVAAKDLAELSRISSETFCETFAEFNAADDMQRYVGHAFSGEKLSAELSNPESVFFFAFMGNEAAGYLKINTGSAQTENHDPSALEIERIYVSAKFQGRRIGQQLLDKAVETALSMTIRTVWLGVWENNVKAIEFYRRNGFEAFGEHVFLLGNDEQRDVLMRKSL